MRMEIEIKKPEQQPKDEARFGTSSGDLYLYARDGWVHVKTGNWTYTDAINPLPAGTVITIKI